MTAYAAMHNAVRSRWDTEIRQALQTPTLYPNQRDRLGRRQVTADLEIESTATELQAWGGETGPCYRKRGSLVVALRDEVGHGDADLLEKAEQIRQTFRHLTVDGVTYEVPSVSAAGRDVGTFEQFWLVNIEAPFYADDQTVQTGAQSVASGPVSQSVAHNAARDRFKTEITVPLGVTTQFDNEAPQSPPRGGLWVHHSVTTTGPIFVSPGKRAQVFGFAFAMIFEPVHQGTDDTLALADEIVLRFRAVTIESVAFGKESPPELRTIGRPEATGPQFYQTNVVMPFLYHEVA